MTDSIDNVPMPKGPKATLVWLQLVLACVALATALGSGWIYKYKTDENTEAIRQSQQEFTTFRTERIQALHLLEQRALSVENELKSRQATLDDMKRHMADQNLHVTASQMKSMIQAELSPLANSVTEVKAKLEVTLPAQQKQLDRMEQLLERLEQRTAPPSR